jgi:hypothetical protein
MLISKCIVNRRFPNLNFRKSYHCYYVQLTISNVDAIIELPSPCSVNISRWLSVTRFSRICAPGWTAFPQTKHQILRSGRGPRLGELLQKLDLSIVEILNVHPVVFRSLTINLAVLVVKIRSSF